VKENVIYDSDIFINTKGSKPRACPWLTALRLQRYFHITFDSTGFNYNL